MCDHPRTAVALCMIAEMHANTARVTVLQKPSAQEQGQGRAAPDGQPPPSPPPPQQQQQQQQQQQHAHLSAADTIGAAAAQPRSQMGVANSLQHACRGLAELEDACVGLGDQHLPGREPSLNGEGTSASSGGLAGGDLVQALNANRALAAENARLNVQLLAAQVQLTQEREANAAHRRKLSRYDALLAKLKTREAGGDGGAIEAHEQTPAEDPPAKSSGSSMHQHLA